MDRISWLLDIIEREHNHKLLLSMKNLQELGANPFPYIVPVLPRPLPSDQGLKYRDILTIYRISVSIDTIYNIDNWLTKISVKNRKYQ